MAREEWRGWADTRVFTGARSSLIPQACYWVPVGLYFVHKTETKMLQLTGCRESWGSACLPCVGWVGTRSAKHPALPGSRVEKLQGILWGERRVAGGQDDVRSHTAYTCWGTSVLEKQPVMPLAQGHVWV